MWSILKIYLFIPISSFWSTFRLTSFLSMLRLHILIFYSDLIYSNLYKYRICLLLDSYCSENIGRDSWSLTSSPVNSLYERHFQTQSKTVNTMNDFASRTNKNYLPCYPKYADSKERNWRDFLFLLENKLLS